MFLLSTDSNDGLDEGRIGGVRRGVHHCPVVGLLATHGGADHRIQGGESQVLRHQLVLRNDIVLVSDGIWEVRCIARGRGFPMTQHSHDNDMVQVGPYPPSTAHRPGLADLSLL
jgi:hypothetical protein